MTINREQIYSALWGIASEAALFATASRRLRHWSDVSPPEQPALFMCEKGGEAKTLKVGTPVTHNLRAEFYIYAHSSDPYAAPATILNPLLDALEAALAPSPVSGVNTLGLAPMVQHAWIGGKIETDEGLLGDQAVALVPVEILAVDPGPTPVIPKPPAPPPPTPFVLTRNQSKTAFYQIAGGDSGTVFDNAGASQEVDLTLPPWAPGLVFGFMVVEPYLLKVLASGGAQIVAEGDSGATISSAQPYSAVTIGTSNLPGVWIVTSFIGSWAVA